MKTINYEKSKGIFIIKYLDDNEIVKGTINVNDKSIKTDLVKYIIDNEEGNIFLYKDIQILLLKKDIELTYDTIKEEKNIPYYYRNNYEKNDIFENIKNAKSINSQKIYFQYYYKKEEYKIPNKISYEIMNGLKRYPRCDTFRPYGYYKEYLKFKTIFINNFLKRFNLSNYNYLVSVPSHESSNNNLNSIALMIRDISKDSYYIDGSQTLIRYKDIEPQKIQGKRYKETHLNSIKVNSDVKGKNIILMDDITTSGCSILACKELLLNAGAANVICFAFSKSS